MEQPENYREVNWSEMEELPEQRALRERNSKNRGWLEKIGADSAIFVPKSALDNLFNWGEKSPTVETTKEFVIAENLHTGEMRNFTIFMRYPSSYAKPYTRYELFCH